MILKHLLPILLLSWFAIVVNASPGDRLPEFKQCVQACQQLTCDNIKPTKSLKRSNRFYNKDYFDDPVIPLHLKLLLWDCNSNCDYQCQKIINFVRKSKNQEIHQFHGKWYFKRLFGCQELASAVFSILNFMSHYYGYNILKKNISIAQKLKSSHGNGYNKNNKNNNEIITLLNTYKFTAIISICAWFFSTVFHIRDLNVTETLDYFFAGATVMSGFYSVTTRCFNLHLVQNSKKRALFIGLCLFIYSCHILRLTIKWGYSYNMKFNIFIGVVQYFEWFHVAITSFVRSCNMKDNSSHAKNISLLSRYTLTSENYFHLTPIFLVLCVSCGMSFELFDFSPINDLVDAHALWHATTVLPGYLWYRWMIYDINCFKDKAI
ncbi:Per1p [Ascoidea rubescens DSM 1968]|uniref:Post-GPI attachment to proteins factor 3 n=1 Tax=Ascoidea rubescens DSM 1968 TaxID=1344418 RepID=A0A1D2VI62_9ASCO|nr:Per1-like protein [Ascoidea rubescens DSM 1968]ODV61299.1 Per1-like protein [Ascoidea rubescens DSM 1968]